MDKRIVEEIEKQPWVFAKTMPNNPHSYSVRKTWDQNIFNEFVNLIRIQGYDSIYEGRLYKKFNLNGYTYWTMGMPLGMTILINRTKTNYDSEYDLIADKYDELFTDKNSIEEDLELMTKIGKSKNVLDVGCGTGLFLNYNKPKKYFGIDVSNEMLKKLSENFPDYANSILNCSVNDFYPIEKFDLIISLYGTASYLTSNEIEKLKTFLNPNGRLFLMAYKAYYYPKTYQMTGIRCKHIIHSFNGFKLQTFNNYVIAKYENLS